MMDKPIRILHVLGGMNRAGAETMIMNLYRNIDRTKLQFDFIVHTNEKCDYDEEIRALGGKIYSIPQYIGKNHFKYILAWNKFFRNHPEYKIIHGHVRSTASIYLKIAKKFELITIAHSHSTSSGTGIASIVKNTLQYPIRFTADYFLACSKFAGEWLFGNKICKKNNFHILKNAIDTKKFNYNENIRLNKREELGIENKFVIGHVGRFQPPKNHDFLIQIFSEIINKNPHSVLLLVGEGELKNKVQKKVIHLGISDSVIFTGKRSDISEIVQAMDVFVFPSLYEGLGIGVVEAQASGLPCVIADTIPQEALITDLVEVLSLKKPKEYWAKEILKYNEKEKYSRNSTYEQIKLNGYDIEETSKWLEKFYLKIIEY
jgi:glycosyltransferase involved in cell wall biosynthesis